MEIRVKRVYDESEPADGFRVLIDRIWPRGISKERAAISLWDKQIAPSTELRHWYQHDPDKWDEFERRYRAELDNEAATGVLHDLVTEAAGGRITLVTAVKELDISHAEVLRRVLTDLG